MATPGAPGAAAQPWRKDLTFYFDEDSATTVEQAIDGRLSTYPNRPILLRMRFMGFRD